MNEYLARRTPRPRWAVLLTLALLACAGGCRVDGVADGQFASSVSRQSNQPSLDDDRAWVTLARVEPLPSWPPDEVIAVELSERGEGRVTRALALLADQRYTESAFEVEKALRTDPRSFAVHSALGRILRATGSKERALLHARKAVQLNPRDASSRYLLGRLLMSRGDFADAVLELRFALLAMEENGNPGLAAVVNFHLAEALETEGYLTAAVARYDAYRSLLAGSSIGISDTEDLAELVQVVGRSAAGQRARVFERLGDYTEASLALGELVQTTDADGDTQRRYAILLAKAGAVERAKSVARRLVGDGAADVGLMRELHAIIGDSQGLIVELGVLATEHPENFALTIALADALQTADRSPAAIEALQASLDSGQVDVEVGSRLVELLTGARQWRRAVGVMALLVDEHPEVDGTIRDHVQLMAGIPEAVNAVLEPGDADAIDGQRRSAAEHYTVGLLAQAVGRSDQAQTRWRRSLAGEPSFIPARMALIEAALDTYRWQEALDLCHAVAPESPADGRLKWMSGRAEDGLDRVDRAVASYNKAIRLNRTDTRPRHSLAELYLRTQRRALAQQQYQALLDVDSLDSKALEALIRLYLLSGERRAAARRLNVLEGLGASPSLLARCRARIELDPRHPDALERYRNTIEEGLDPADPDHRSIYEIALSYLEEERYEDARSQFDRVIGLIPNHLGALEGLALAHAGLLEYEERIGVLRLMLGRHPNRLTIRHALTIALLDDQAYEDARVTARDALEGNDLTNEERQVFRLLLVTALQAAGRVDEIVTVVLRWQQESDDQWLRNTLMDAYLKADRIDDAVEMAQQAYDRNRPDPIARQVLLATMVAAERFEQASQFVLRRLEDDPDNDRALRSLIEVLLVAGQYDDAVELARANLLRARDPVPYKRALLDIYVQAERYDEAEALLSEQMHSALARAESLRGDPDAQLELYSFRLQLAYVWVSARRYDKAQARIAGWLAETQHRLYRFEYLKILSSCHTQRGQQRQAIEALEMAHQIAPRDPGVCNDLGYMLADSGLRLDEAEALVRYAVAAQPRSSAYLDSLGWVLYKRGRYEQADRWLRKATRTGQDVDPVILDHLGDACWRLGLGEEAVEFWEQVRDLTESAETPDARVLRESAGDKLRRINEGGVPPVAATVDSPPAEAM